MTNTTTAAKRTHTAALVLLTCAALSLGACGEDRGQRFLSGAALGAGAGMLTTAVLGGQAMTGAIVGSAIGGAAGLVSEHSWWDGVCWRQPSTWVPRY
jgi:hypothetical protein